MTKYMMLLIALVIGLSTLQAGTITETVGPVSMPGYVMTSYSGQQISLAKFDISKGTLLGVSISFTGYMKTDFQFENKTDSDVNMTWAQNGGASLYQGATNLGSVVLHQEGSEVIGAYDQMVDWLGTSGRTYTKTTSLNTIINVAYANLDAYKGPGTILFSIEGTGAGTVSGTPVGGGTATFEVSNTTYGLGSVSIEYTYQTLDGGTVPEPTSMFLMGLVVFIVSAIIRKKNVIQNA